MSSDTVLADLAMLRRVAALPKPTHVFVSLFGPNGNLAEHQRLAGLRTEEP